MITAEPLPLIGNAEVRHEMPPRFAHGRIKANLPWAEQAIAAQSEVIKPFVISYGNDDSAYAVYAPFNGFNGDKSEHITMVDYRGDKFMGYADMAYMPFSNCLLGRLPFIDSAQTERAFRGQGLYQRRLQTLGALTSLIVGEQLHSSPIITNSAMKSWQSLEKQGRAEAVIIDGVNRWRMK